MVDKVIPIIIMLMYALSNVSNILFNENILNKNLINSSDHFRIYEVRNENYKKYNYQIINKDGNIIKNRNSYKFPHIVYLNNTEVLSVTIGAGTGVFNTQFFNIKTNEISEIFLSPILIENRLVIYINIIENIQTLIIRDFFDVYIFYMTLPLYFSPIANPFDAIVNIEFINENTISFSYFSGIEFYIKNLTINLVNY